ncbi:MAG: MAPEG family protein [Xanthomonadales bacterium]|nr:MAPEG family protein [Xanthomonadales bacterium]
MPRITAFYAALAMLLVVTLAVRVMLRRRQARIGLGNGGDAELGRRVRAHANALENLVPGLLLLLLLELLVIAPLWLHLAGATLLLGRALHAVGLSRSGGVSFGRGAGMLLTWLVLLAMALVLLWQSVMWWLIV